jgi:2-methylcitrate dehydratase PrpD
VIEGMLTKNDPSDLQSAQLSVPFSLAMALSLGRTRGARAAIRYEDYKTALASPAVGELSRRVRCVVDPEIEAAMADNLCRCGTYQRIMQAVRRASELAQA